MPNRSPISSHLGGQFNDHPIVSILEDLTTDELARLAADIVRENRQRVDRTQSLFEEFEKTHVASADDDNHHALRHTYRLALLQLKVHHELIRLVVDALGYVPEVPSDPEMG